MLKCSLNFLKSGSLRNKMTFLEFKNNLKNFPVFSRLDIEKTGLTVYPQRLAEWQNKNYLEKICRGFYAFTDLETTQEVLFFTANKIYDPSYISLETALSIYNLIPEAVYTATSVTTRKTNQTKTGWGSFSYRHIKPSLFFGYKIERYLNYSYKIAEMEKAVLDYLYLHPEMDNTADLKEWRFNAGEFLEKVDLEKWQNHLKRINSRTLNSRAKKFLSFINA